MTLEIDAFIGVSKQHGPVIAELAQCLVDRGFDEVEVVRSLEGFDSDAFWDSVLGPAVDRLEDVLGLVRTEA